MAETQPVPPSMNRKQRMQNRPRLHEKCLLVASNGWSCSSKSSCTHHHIPEAANL